MRMLMTRLCAAAALAAALSATTAAAQEQAPLAAAKVATAAPASEGPSAQEKKDAELLQKTLKDISRTRFPGLARHVPDLSEALDRSLTTPPHDPGLYLTMGILIGSYYVEMHQNEKAVAALDKGLTHGPADPTANGEKGVALAGMRRFPEALAAYDAGLAGGQGGPADQARLHRGRGVLLIDLKRLDDAEAALKTSLQLQPNHPVALNELKYIAEIRKGAPDDRPLDAPITVEEAVKAPLH